MLIDENLVFVSLITLVVVFIVYKQPYLIGIIILIAIAYYFYKTRFTNPRHFFSFLTTTAKEAFEPCSINNPSYCGGNATNSNYSFLPDIMRSAPVSNNINKMSKVVLKMEDYQIDNRLKGSIAQISIDEIIRAVPPLLDYKLYLEKIIKFVININTDDTIQKDFLAKTLQNKMTKIFYNAYNTVSDKKYPIHTYNEMLYAQKEFDGTINIFIYLGMNDTDNEKLNELQKEFKTINNKVNEYIIEKVNDIMPNDYDITTSFLPQKDEPQGMGTFDNYINL